MSLGGIYSIVNTFNSKIYIGSTIQINRRKTEHWYLLKHNRHPNRHLQNAWNKYGEKAFEFRIVELCIDDVLIQREQSWINYYKSMDRNFGYNIENANRTTFTEEHRRHLSESMMGRKSGFKGKKHTDESKEMLSKSHIGKCFLSKKGREAISLNAIKVHTGMKRTEETKEKLRKAWLIRKQNKLEAK